MPIYKYKAMQLDGKSVSGEQTAKDKTELRQVLLDKELYLTEASEKDAAAVRVRIKPRELAAFCRELGTMLSSGVPLVRAIDIMRKRDLKPNQKQIYDTLFNEIRNGKMLSTAMEEQGNTFPPLLINMFKASEANGNIDVTALKMAEHYEKSYKLSKKARTAMVYPILLLCITIIVLLVVFLLVLPKFFEIYNSLGTELPGLTKFMLNLSEGLKNNWLYVLIGVLVIILAIKLIAQIPAVKKFNGFMKLKLPVVGKLNRTIYTARFARTLSSSYSSGISIINALDNTKDTVDNTYVSSQFPAMIQEVRSGASLSSAIAKIDGFDSKLGSSIMIGEETGRLDSMLNSTADAFDYEADAAMARLVALLEPILIVIMAVLVGTVMISVMLPLANLYSTIGAGA